MKMFLFFLLIPLIFCSCVSSYQIENYSSDRPDETQARIIVVRPSIFGVVSRASIHASNNFVGKVGPASYLAWNVNPGAVVLECNKNYFKVNARPGKNYYILLRPKISFSSSRPVYEFYPLSQEEGEKKVARLSKPFVKNS